MAAIPPDDPAVPAVPPVPPVPPVPGVPGVPGVPAVGASGPDIDSSVPHSARIWNYWLGGTDNYPVDRAAGDAYRESYPQIVAVARASRDFLARAVSYLAGPARIRQFLDVGSGLPAQDNTHQIAERVAAGCRVVYVDNDPLVLAHARRLLAGSPPGAGAGGPADLAVLAGVARKP